MDRIIEAIEDNPSLIQFLLDCIERKKVLSSPILFMLDVVNYKIDVPTRIHQCDLYESYKDWGGKYKLKEFKTELKKIGVEPPTACRGQVKIDYVQKIGYRLDINKIKDEINEYSG